ncbi:hypothetical protein ATCC90586_008482 [Pythium insidiosum]|nr:hypothetical protein ATCC90586_008482 [Pythium insidiosum]
MAELATRELVDAEYHERQLRHAVRRWLIAAAAAQHRRQRREKAIAWHMLSQLRRSWRAWRSLRQHRLLTARARRFAAKATLRSCFWRWHDNAERAGQLDKDMVEWWSVHRASKWRLKIALAQWRRHVAGSVRLRMLRLFHRWRRGRVDIVKYAAFCSASSKSSRYEYAGSSGVGISSTIAGKQQRDRGIDADACGSCFGDGTASSLGVQASCDGNASIVCGATCLAAGAR